LILGIHPIEHAGRLHQGSPSLPTDPPKKFG
jgi:hypothetical protein